MPNDDDKRMVDEALAMYIEAQADSMEVFSTLMYVLGAKSICWDWGVTAN